MSTRRGGDMRWKGAAPGLTPTPLPARRGRARDTGLLRGACWCLYNLSRYIFYHSINAPGRIELYESPAAGAPA